MNEILAGIAFASMIFLPILVATLHYTSGDLAYGENRRQRRPDRSR